MRIVAWNCWMALHRKFDAVMRLRPDIAVICECVEPQRLAAFGALNGVSGDPVWIGDNRNKGLAVFTCNGTAPGAEPFYPTIRHIAPVHISGPVECNLLAVWAQNASAGIHRKHQLGPLRRAEQVQKLSDGASQHRRGRFQQQRLLAPAWLAE